MAHSFSWHDLVRYFHHWNEAFQWPLFFILGWITIYVRRWRRSREQEAAQGWPSVNGKILSGKATKFAHTSRYFATLEYSFFITEYHYGKYTQEFTKKEDADNFVQQMRNKEVPIRYNPSNPDRSVLEQRTVEQHIMLTPRFG
jgi:hypothetical protein